MASAPSPRAHRAPDSAARASPPRRADHLLRASSSSPHPRSAARASAPRRDNSSPASMARSPSPRAHSASDSAAGASPPRRADLLFRSSSPSSPHPRSAARASAPRRETLLKSSLLPHPHSALSSAAACSPPRCADSVRVYALREAYAELIAELGCADGALHAAQGPEQAPVQSQGQAEVIILFRSNGAICGVASLLPDAPRPDLFASDDGSGGDVDADLLEECDDDEDDFEDEDEDDDDPSSTTTVMGESSNDGSTDEDNEDGYDEWEEGDSEKQENKSEPSYFLKLEVWPSSAYANIVLFDGLEWLSTIRYSFNWLSSMEAQIMVEKLADPSQDEMKLDNTALVSNTMMLLRRGEYEGAMVNSSAVQWFVNHKLSPSLNDFIDQTLLGKGAYSNVRLCTSQYDNKDYAIKIIKIQEHDRSEPREICILSSLRSQHVVKFLQAWTETHIFVDYEDFSQDDAGNSGEGTLDMQHTRYVLIHMELCSRSLEDYIFTQSRKVDAETRQIFRELAEGLQYIHGENVIHRDIKPANIFIGQDGRVKLGDFGQSRVHPSHAGSFKGTPYLGTAFYGAPELYEAENISEKVDIYSAGAIYLELFKQYKTAIEEIEFTKYTNADVSKINWEEGNILLFKKMVASDPLERPSADELLAYISEL